MSNRKEFDRRVKEFNNHRKLILFYGEKVKYGEKRNQELIEDILPGLLPEGQNLILNPEGYICNVNQATLDLWKANVIDDRT